VSGASFGCSPSPSTMAHLPLFFRVWWVNHRLRATEGPWPVRIVQLLHRQTSYNRYLHGAVVARNRRVNTSTAVSGVGLRSRPVASVPLQLEQNRRRSPGNIQALAAVFNYKFIGAVSHRHRHPFFVCLNFRGIKLNGRSIRSLPRPSGHIPDECIAGTRGAAVHHLVVAAVGSRLELPLLRLRCATSVLLQCSPSGGGSGSQA
jgi:hypothetical protein